LLAHSTLVHVPREPNADAPIFRRGHEEEGCPFRLVLGVILQYRTVFDWAWNTAARKNRIDVPTPGDPIRTVLLLSGSMFAPRIVAEEIENRSHAVSCVDGSGDQEFFVLGHN
jgi:hypothetical protein